MLKIATESSGAKTNLSGSDAEGGALARRTESREAAEGMSEQRTRSVAQRASTAGAPRAGRPNFYIKTTNIL